VKLAGLAIVLALAFSTGAASAARAAWLRVETERFVVYGEGEKSVRELAAKLVTYDMLLRAYHPSAAKRPSATKVQVFLVNGRADLRRVRPSISSQIAGFYTAMNEGVFAFAVKDRTLGPETVLFHEYAHHFMLENFPAAYPAWFTEGLAEYFANTQIKENGEVHVGGYNESRVYSLQLERWVPFADLLTKSVWELHPADRSVFYSQAWLLMHYMRSDPVRAAQLHKATEETANGADPLKAFESATGMTAEQLTLRLRQYRKLTVRVLQPRNSAPTVPYTTLPPSADDLILDNLRLILHPTGRVDAAFLADVRKKAARYPGDALAERTLARAEFVMGDVAAGEAIMARRVAANEKDVEDLLLAGTGQVMAGIRDEARRADRFRAGRTMLGKAYQLDQKDFRSLFTYAYARQTEPGFPTDNDVNVLLKTRDLAPSVREIVWRAGLALNAKGRIKEAEVMGSYILDGTS
jgi:hypothetical protein